MEFRNRDINPRCTLLEALKKMDAIDRKLLLVVDGDKFHGLLSAGDIQRAIIRNESLTNEVRTILRKDIRTADACDEFDVIREMMLEYRMELCPVVGENDQIVKIYFWEDLFKDLAESIPPAFNIPVVIMAGGFGTRLKPITSVLPKPLIPIGEKTMLEEIFERFNRHGCDRFFISINYKAELIKFYLDGLNLPLQLKYFHEDYPRGTAGSLTLLKGQIEERFFVNNCDILIEQDYSEILDYHVSHQNEITLVAVLKTFPIPYGTIETEVNGRLTALREKPDLTFKINSGMYLLEPHLLSEIPEGEFFHITDLINKVKLRNGKVGVFPVSEKSWKDVGSWEEYFSIISKIDSKR